MHKTDWSPRRLIELRYENALSRLYSRLFQFAGGIRDPEEFTDRLREAADAGWLDEFAQAAASRMIVGLRVDGARTWRQAAQTSMRGQEIYRALQNEMISPVGVRVYDLVRNNAQLIKSVPLTLADDITRRSMELSQKGLRASEIAKDLREWVPTMTRGKVQLISRTEVSKASTALTRARSEEIGAGWYIWRSSEDGRVRLSHRFMDKQGGVLCSWDDAPAPEALIGIKSTLGHYGPGECPNCRCYPEPLLRLSHTQWPHRVHTAGVIRMMARAEFVRIAGFEVAA